MDNKNQHQFSNREKMPDAVFKVMRGVMWLFDAFGNYSNRKFITLGLKPGQTVIDYGCGPARYIKNASETVGKEGKVIAIDIHPKAIESVYLKIEKFKLKNVEPILADGYKTPLPGNSADVIYALDMFHMVQDPTALLKEFQRLLKPEGLLILEDGHQSRENTLKKVNDSACLKITEENKSHIKCVPV